jgi:hypothetical protein
MDAPGNLAVRLKTADPTFLDNTPEPGRAHIVIREHLTVPYKSIDSIV